MESNLVLGDGPIPCTGMIVGEAPGATEEREGRPFVGPSGALLEEALEAAGTSRSKVYITNAYKIRPPGNRNPSEAELEAHRGLLEDELSAVSPLVIMTLGNVATGALTGFFNGITSRHGEEHQYRVGEEIIPVIPVFHPAYVLRYKSMKPQFFEDVATFVKRTLSEV